MNKFEQAKNLLFSRETLQQRELRSERELRRWNREKLILEQEQQIMEERHELLSKKWQKRLPFSKMFAIFLFANFTVLEIFTAWVTIQSFTLAYAIGTMPDFSPLLTLLGAVMGQTLSYWIYSSKAKAENTKGGIEYETIMYGLKQSQIIDNEGNVG